jgi:hypothetical protein
METVNRTKKREMIAISKDVSIETLKEVNDNGDDQSVETEENDTDQ